MGRRCILPFNMMRLLYTTCLFSSWSSEQLFWTGFRLIDLTLFVQNYVLLFVMRKARQWEDEDEDEETFRVIYVI